MKFPEESPREYNKPQKAGISRIFRGACPPILSLGKAQVKALSKLPNGPRLTRQVGSPTREGVHSPDQGMSQEAEGHEEGGSKQTGASPGFMSLRWAWHPRLKRQMLGGKA